MLADFPQSEEVLKGHRELPMNQLRFPRGREVQLAHEGCVGDVGWKTLWGTAAAYCVFPGSLRSES